MEKKSDLLKKKYGFKLGSYKYILPGGELMRYIGQPVIRITFTKKPIEGAVADENGEVPSAWENKFDEVTILSLGEFDPMQMTWLCKYKLSNEEEVREVRIMPEGYSFTGEDPEKVGEIIRLIPFSKHHELLEDQNFFLRLEELWKERATLTPEALLTLTKSKGQEATLKYTHNIGALIRLNDDAYDPAAGESRFLWIRIHKLSLHHNHGSKFNLRFSNDDRSWSFMIDAKDAEFSFEGDLGKFKIIDLSEGTMIKPQIEDIEPDKEEVADPEE